MHEQLFSVCLAPIYLNKWECVVVYTVAASALIHLKDVLWGLGLGLYAHQSGLSAQKLAHPCFYGTCFVH